MKHYMYLGEVYAYPEDGSQDHIIPAEAALMDQAALDAYQQSRLASLTPEDRLAIMSSVSRPQMLAALVDFEIITEVEAIGWIGGTLPEVVQDAIDALPASQQLVARLRAVAQTPVDPSDPLVAALAASKEMGNEAIILLFDYAAGL